MFKHYTHKDRLVDQEFINAYLSAVDSGVQGVVGSRGFAGSTGPQGDAGIQGAQGLKGYSGLKWQAKLIGSPATLAVDTYKKWANDNTLDATTDQIYLGKPCVVTHNWVDGPNWKFIPRPFFSIPGPFLLHKIFAYVIQPFAFVAWTPTDPPQHDDSGLGLDGSWFFAAVPQNTQRPASPNDWFTFGDPIFRFWPYKGHREDASKGAVKAGFQGFQAAGYQQFPRPIDSDYFDNDAIIAGDISPFFGVITHFGWYYGGVYCNSATDIWMVHGDATADYDDKSTGGGRLVIVIVYQEVT